MMNAASSSSAPNVLTRAATKGQAQVSTHLPRQTLLLLVGALLSSLVLHLNYLPVWFYAAAVFVLGWRALVYFGYLSFPGRVAKTITVLIASYGVYVTAGGQITLEGSGAFLASAGLLKLLEMANRRDAVFVVFMALFLQASGFLFDQSIFAAAQGIFTMLLAMAAMISAQSANRSGIHPELPVFATAGRLMLFSIPFMLIVYFLFPRLGPLWSVALNSDSSMTGLSTRMQPGDISSLSQSSEVAFRVTFDDEKPAQRDLYWRVMTLDFHDGSGWAQSKLDQTAVIMPQKTDEHRYEYEIIQEATGQQFLFSLSESVSETQGVEFAMTRVLYSDRPIYERKRYRVASIGTDQVVSSLITGTGITTFGKTSSGIKDPTVLKGRVETDALDTSDAGRTDKNSSVLSTYSELPNDSNAQTIAWAKTLPPNTAEFIQAFTQYISQQAFYYTLKPPKYGDNDIDKFLFEGRRGFCEHYASAMAFAARAAGIPSRVVAGYQGGEWHTEGHLTVRQYDAHAWVELWTGQVWQRVDPTAAVAPSRIEYGLERAVENEGSFLSQELLSPHRYRSINWINNLRLKMDNINYLWSRWVLSYDEKKQSDFLSRWFGLDDLLDGLYILASTIAGLFVFGTVWQWWLQRPAKERRLILAWAGLIQQAEKAGVSVDSGLPPLSLLSRLAEYYPELSDDCAEAQRLFITAQYGEGPDLHADALLARQLKGVGRRLRGLDRKMRRDGRRPSTKTSASSDV